MKVWKFLLVSLLILYMIKMPVVAETSPGGCSLFLKFQQGSTDYWIENMIQSPMETAPVNKHDRLFLVVRYVTESLPETEIFWDENDRKITISQGSNKTIELWIGKSNSIIGGISTQIDPNNSDVVPFIENGRTLLPLRFISENLDGEVHWKSETKTVTINFPAPCPEKPNPRPEPKKIKAGGELLTKVNVSEVGKIIVRCKLPEHPRYPEGAPVSISASGWFVPFRGFHTCIDTTEIGCIKVDYLWPGREDGRAGVASEGTEDHGGPIALKAFSEVIKFATGEVPNVDGHYISELLEIIPLTNNVGIYAFSHSGVVATNVMALHGDKFPKLKWFIGRENPTIDEMYPLELGYYLDDREKTPVYNPFYHPEDYSPTTIDIDYSKVNWIQNKEYPDGRPIFKVDGGKDHILCHKHPTMWGKTYYSRKLTHALLDNGALTLENWPENLATPAETDEAWSSRICAFSYPKLKNTLPNLKTMLIFQDEDHVQAAPDKPHIHQAWDGLHHAANLWCRLNPDKVYVENLHGRELPPNKYPDTPANSEPEKWDDARNYGYKGLSGRYNTVEIPFAAIAEMCDRTRADNWKIDLNEIIYEYTHYKTRRPKIE